MVPNPLIRKGWLAQHAKGCYTIYVSQDQAEPRMVQCFKLGESLPAMIYRPFQDELGEKIYREISQNAWNSWIEHSKMLVNEYRLDLTSEESHTKLKEQCETFLFGGEEEQAPPPEFVPETA